MGKYDFDFDLYEEDTLSWIATEINEKSKVLEFGAANGRLTKYLSQEKKCVVDIVEIDEESGIEAARYARNALLGNTDGDIEQYRWLELDEQYDFVVFADVLEHLVNPQKVLKCCKSKMKENGKVVISIPNISHNSIIIGLMNDSFEYNSIGLLDNTHLRFFTRKTFAKMVESVGWAIVEERAKYIRVGENEINSYYSDVSKEVFKELIKRDNGEVYQYMFILARSSEYLKGKIERKVSFDPYSHYYTEAFFSIDDEFSYKKSISKYIVPSKGDVNICLSVHEGSKSGIIYPINCNCVLQINNIFVQYKDGEKRSIDYQHNGDQIGNSIWFVKSNPQISVKLDVDVVAIEIEMNIMQYDFQDNFTQTMYEIMCEQKRKLSECIDTYEKMIARKDQEFLESVNIYEREMERRDNEYREKNERNSYVYDERKVEWQ